jgi:pimeloyl-ACP methyl ester carboxylesterase
MQTHEIEPPSRALLLAEARAIYELGAFIGALPWLRRLPAGDGHPVMVLPGLGASDLSTAPLRAFLRDRGYAAYGWELGRNFGVRHGLTERKLQRLRHIRRHHGRKVSLIGWSLGGVFAREIAKNAPDDVRVVITMGSPFKNPKATHAQRFYELLAGHSIFSRSDGVVAWQSSVEDKRAHTESVEVWASHCGLGHNPAAVYVIADRLAQPEGRWAHFDRSGLRSLIYPDPWREGAPRSNRQTSAHEAGSAKAGTNGKLEPSARKRAQGRHTGRRPAKKGR